ncbi:MAG: serine hydrolase [Planctomycetia bacterium]|nr:serine hydrolase [Planctomycetia bacterium]
MTLIRFLVSAILVVVLIACETLEASPPRLPLAAPADIGFDAPKLAEIDGVVEQALTEKKMPGCVVAIGRRDRLAIVKAFGQRQLEPSSEAMTTDTIFDLASLTKPIATATSIMLLIERGKLRLDDPVAKHWPEFADNGKEKINIEHLLTHTGGLIADNRIADYLQGPEKAWSNIASLKPLAEPNVKFTYSDVGFEVLGKLVENISGLSVAEFAKTNVFDPLGMSETDFKPKPELRLRIAPTEKRNGEFIRGEVHDPRAHLLGGIAGHAGLFSTAEDLAKYAAAMVMKGQLGETRIMSEVTWTEMTRPRNVPSGKRALGWDMKTGYSSNRGASMSDYAFGHGGFTGTALWIDPDTGLFVIFLSNRVHPDGKGSVNPLAGRIGTIAADAIRP